jgi:putative NADPH-quinone reductase
MGTLVVQAHPVPDSLNAALLARVRAGLDAAGIGHRVFRLADGARPDAASLAGAERLILVYPTWWGGQPALLLDWLQEVMLEERAFDQVAELVAVTSLGSSRLLNRVQGEWGRAHLAGPVLGACASGATFEWLPLYKIDRQSPAAIEAHLDRVERRFRQARPDHSPA